MVDAANRGWHDSNGLLSKQIVESKILPVLNAKLGCQKTYHQYQSRLKWFKTRYQSFTQLMRHSSGFGWDSISKKFAATEESHPSQVHLQRDTFADYKDLVIAIGNGTVAGKNSIGLGDDINARTYEVGESRPTKLQDSNEAFVPSQNETSYQSMSSSNFTSSHFLDTNLDAPLENLPQRKKPKIESEANNNSVETITRAELVEKVYVGMDSIAAITTEIRGMHSLMEKREKEREKTNNVWDAIKETPNLDNHTRYKALGLVHKLGMKNAFLKMLPEERSKWILYNME
ncbi:PREDICTED: uncharacterized protein At2g29880-like [Prunus mume]|uniref:Uncharacterized protein At2g29880-like n=1 Tax=Prunus mume TaxID=102107 RepID=A0ABM0PBP5_PRUMU|nr:PREDICTED: uncharacterized protein At2g29880-like [Prunus mume]